MAINPAFPPVVSGGLGQGIGIYPGQQLANGNHTHVVWNPTAVGPTYDPPWQPDECGRTVIRKIENGFIVVFQKSIGASAEQYYCETMKDVGERITACMVKNMLEGEKK